jgi:Na+/H+-dicarboxylate symporter
MLNRLTILVGMLLGILTGWYCHATLDEAGRIATAGYFQIISDMFLRLIKMIIAPLVLSTLIFGIAHMGDSSSLGRVGIKTLVWFLGASVISLALGAILVTLLEPGSAMNLPQPPENAQSGIAANAMSLKDFVTHLIPKSIAEAMVNNELLQIVVFSIFFGVATAALGEKGKMVVELAEQISHVMLKVTGYVMNFAPLAVFAALAANITTKGLAILGVFGIFITEFYLALLLLWLVLIGAGFMVLGPRVFRLIKGMREPIALAFSTASSEAAYPRTLEELQKFGVSKKIGSFVLPLGYSFNLDGSMMYCTFATLFIAQVYNIHLDFSQIATMLLILMVTSKGMAGVPRASLVVIAGTLAFFDIPEAGLLLILGVDHFLDMGRSATNVVGNSIATAVVAKWENELDKDDTSSPSAPSTPVAS